MNPLPTSLSCWLHCSSTDTHRSTDSNHHLPTVDLTIIRQIHQHTARLSTHLSQDLLTQTHHQNACISFTTCTRSESSSRFLQDEMTNLIVLVVLVPLLHPPLSCSTNLATYQTQRKIQDIAEALSYRVLLFSSPYISLQNYLALLELSILSCLRSIFSLCCISSTICSILYLLPKTIVFFSSLTSTHYPFLTSSPFFCRLLIFLLKRSVASSRSFSKTFSSDPIQSRIRCLAILIEHTSSMLAAAISIPAHSSKESHAIFMQYWWGAVTLSQLMQSYSEP